MFAEGPPRLEISLSEEGVYVAVPYMPEDTDDVERVEAELLRGMLESQQIENYVLWFYTPMALTLSDGLTPLAVVYDCMDQLAAFKNAPACLIPREDQLLARADVVFTGGQALYENKRHRHSNIHAFPSSVDVSHFAEARNAPEEPADQAGIAHPRLGFFGVIDERMDIELLRGIADARPDWQLVVLGPVVKIDEEDLPRAPNIHYLGSKSYSDLPKYIADWDVALLPFARNESTEFISPTKTPEYLAAGKPVVSTAIRDVVRPYEALGLARIANTVDEFVAACEAAMREPVAERLTKADTFLSKQSWDETWRRMAEHVDRVVERRRPRMNSDFETSAASGVIAGDELNLSAGGE